MLVTDGFDGALLAALQKAVAAEGARLELVAPEDRRRHRATTARPSTVDQAPSPARRRSSSTPWWWRSAPRAPTPLAAEAAAIDWMRDAYGHLKAIGMTSTSRPLVALAQVTPDPGVIALDDAASVDAYLTAARMGRIWERESMVRTPV